MTQVTPQDGHMTFAALYDRIAPLVYGITRRVVRDPAMADDVTRDVLVELWRHADRYDETRGSVESWATMLAHRRAADRVRRNGLTVDALADAGPDDAALDVAQRHNLHLALDGVGYLQRQAIQLAFLDGMTQRQIAEMLDVPLGTVSSRIRDGLHLLRHDGLTNANADGVARVSPSHE